MALKPVLAGSGYYNTPAASTPATPGGAPGTIQFNSAGSFGGITSWSSNGTTTLVGSGNGALSTPILSLTGTVFTGGSATTTKPHFLIEPAGTTSTNWSTSGTQLGINGVSGFAGRLLDLQVAAVSKLRVTSSGAVFNPDGYFLESVLGSGNRCVSIENVAGGGTGRLALNAGAEISWSSSVNDAGTGRDLFLFRKGAATLQLGLDAAGVTNQMLTAANRITSDGVGANLTVAPGNGRGGAGGTLILSTFTTAGAATAGTLTSRLTIDTAGVTVWPTLAATPDAAVVSTHTARMTFGATEFKVLLATP